MESSYFTFIGIQLTGCHMMPVLAVGGLETDYSFTYVCFVCVCVCVCVCVRAHACMRACMHVCVHMYVYVCQ